MPKEHVENPSMYDRDEILKCAPKNIRVPKKCRKTAMKRFLKAFGNFKVDKQNRPHWSPNWKKLPPTFDAQKILNK